MELGTLWGRTGRSSSARRGRSARRGGFTLVELSLAVTILLVALMSVSAATLGMHSLRRQNRDRTVATNAIRAMSERIHARSAEASASPGSWAQTLVAEFGSSGTPGDTFEVLGLNVVPGQSSVGTVQIVTDETATDAELGYELGMPRDLNGDGDADDTNVSNGARLLPVIVSVHWNGASGVARIDHPFYVMGY